MEISGNKQLELALKFVQYTEQHIFLTGKAGTGKTTFLKNLKKISPKRMVVVAPTGVAAINAGGVTIHSFFQMPFGPYIPNYANGAEQFSGVNIRNVPAHVKKFNKEKIKIIKSLDLLVIDEISMVRADLLDGVDEVLRRYRDRSKPFGGVQLLMIGDLQQLAPIVKEDEWEILQPYYDTMFFFGSMALQKTNYVSIELQHIYRQRDKNFIDLLNSVRENKTTQETLDKLNKRYIKDFQPKDDEGYITLTTHNRQAQDINENKLEKIAEKEYRFKATIEGNFPEYMYPTEEELSLKLGVQVMFVKNDPSRDKLFYNGKIGKIVDIDEDSMYVRCPDSDDDILVERLTWQNMKYSIDEETKDIRETEIGSFTQFPLKLAWAITIHKSQGLTFEKAIIDARAAFAHGQVYVALSRCKSFEGLVLGSPIPSHAVISDNTVHKFTRNIEDNPPGDEVLTDSILDYQISLLDELFDFTNVKWGVYNLLKQVKEHAESLIGLKPEYMEVIDTSAKETILDVADKFVNQRRALVKEEKDIEKNEKLQERIKKACEYFAEKLNAEILEKVGSITFDTDNKEARKSIKDALKKLLETLYVKKACFEASKTGFDVKAYLEVRAKSAIEDAKPDVKIPKIEAKAGDEILHPELFNLLKSWRMQKASADGIPAYMILHQKALLGIVNSLPQNHAQLKNIKGIGKRTAELHGEDIINYVKAYCEESNIEVSEEIFQELKVKKHGKSKESKVKVDTKKVSLDLLNEGKTIEEIANLRGLAVSTVEEHLAHFVGTSDLDVKRFVPFDKIEMITEFYTQSDNRKLAPAKEALGDYVTWGELRFVVKYLESLEKH